MKITRVAKLRCRNRAEIKFYKKERYLAQMRKWKEDQEDRDARAKINSYLNMPRQFMINHPYSRDNI